MDDTLHDNEVSYYQAPDTTAEWSNRFPRQEWFDVWELASRVWVIAEPGHVNSFLVEGRDRAVLLDTGLGIGNIRSVVDELTDKPILVVNSHHHFDHTGGNLLFEQIAIHRHGEIPLATGLPEALAHDYFSYLVERIEAWSQYKDLDDRYFHLLTRETLVRPLPRSFDAGQYAPRPARATHLLDDGEVIDLGGRSLRVIHTPGHTSDSVCLLDEKRGLLFGGDTINIGPIYAQFDESDVPAFASSTKRLAEMSTGIDRVFVCHYMRAEGGASLLTEIADGFDRILSGAVECHDDVDVFGSPVKVAWFDHCSIFLPRHFARVPQVAGT